MTINLLDYKTYQTPGDAQAGPNPNHRVERRNIKRLVTARYVIVLTKNQYFCETKAAYEIWEEGEGALLHRVKRISKKSVLWVIPK